MDSRKLSELIRYIVSEVNDKDGYVTTIRLVKFLYLIDLEYYRIRTSLLTDLKWVFHLFGPYSNEIPKAGAILGYNLKREDFKTEEGHKGVFFRVDDIQSPPSWLDSTSLSVIDRILKVWCDQDTQTLLDYVYTQTEPMILGKRNDPLDFSNVVLGSRFYNFQFNEINQETRKKFVSSIRETFREDVSDLIPSELFRDDSYLDFKRTIEEEEKQPSFSGIYFEDQG